jgi:hypothetical protein
MLGQRVSPLNNDHALVLFFRMRPPQPQLLGVPTNIQSAIPSRIVDGSTSKPSTRM